MSTPQPSSKRVSIVVGTASQGIISGAAHEVVVAFATGQLIVAIVAEQFVVTVASVGNIGTAVTVEFVIASSCFDRCVRWGRSSLSYGIVATTGFHDRNTIHMKVAQETWFRLDAVKVDVAHIGRGVVDVVELHRIGRVARTAYRPDRGVVVEDDGCAGEPSTQDNLRPRGIPGNEPVWSPDGTRLAFTLPTAYSTDVFIVNADGTGFRNLSNTPNYNFWPSWSPDGTKLAFVSDRQQCPSWFPNAPDTCDSPDATPPTFGTLYVYEFTFNRTSPITDTRVTAPPTWINTRMISVSSGSLDPLSDETDLWVYDVAAGSTWKVNPEDDALYAAPSWRPEGDLVVFQRIGSASEVVFAERFGTQLGTLEDYIFVRFGLAGNWSPDGTRLAIGGSNRQCPYGLLVLDTTFDIVNTPNDSLLACDPTYSPDSTYLAYEGIRVARGTDGRLDIYIASQDGVTVRNVTSDLEGELELIGWVGPTFGN